MANPDQLRDDQALMFIKGHDYGTFRALALKHISSNSSKDHGTVVSLGAEFLRSHEEKLWPASNRQHLEQSPAAKDMEHWQQGKNHPKGIARGSIFQHDTRMSIKGKKYFRRSHDGRDPNISEAFAYSKLAKVLQRYLTEVVVGDTIPPQYPIASEEELLQRLLGKGFEISLQSRPEKPSGSVSATNSEVVLTKSIEATEMKSKQPETTWMSDAMKCQSLQPVNGATADTMDDGRGASSLIQTTCKQRKRVRRPLSRARRRERDNAADATRQTRSDDNAANAIRALRSNQAEGLSFPAAVAFGKKLVVDAPLASNSAFKKRKSSEGNSCPPRGTFTIPRDLRRVEAVPLDDPVCMQRDAASYLAAVRPAGAPAPVSYDWQSSVFWDEPLDPQDATPLDEAARRRRLAQYMVATGGMGGLPVV